MTLQRESSTRIMGIPHYFKQVTQQFDNILSRQHHKTCERLFLDFNCAIHKCSNDLKKIYDLENRVQHELFEKDLIHKCEQFILDIVALIKPSKLVYVSIDGVVPMAKISQQRKRRYFSDWKKKKLRQVLATQHQDNSLITRLDNDWNTNQITPGTAFMDQLVKQLNDFADRFSKDSNLNIIVDASAGEGEHKICHYIHANNESSLGDIIYGLDADMILLGMLSCNVDNTTLVREDIRDSSVYVYMNLKNTRDQIYLQFSSFIGDNTNTKSFLIKCYIFLTFFLGNDFLPNLTYVHLRENGLNILIRIYSKCFEFFQREQHILTEDIQINSQFFNYFIELLEQDENSKMIAIDSKYYSDKMYNNKHIFKNPTNVEDVVKTESGRIDMYPHMRKFPKNLIELNKPGWRIQYYYHLFEQTTSSDIANNACKQYVLGLMWLINYYFKRTTNWNWHYEYNYSPTMLDLSNYVQLPNIWSNNEKIISQNTTRINEDEQLIMVIPPSSMNDCFKSRPYLHKYTTDVSSNILHIFPTDFEITTYLKSFLHECGGIGLNIKSRIHLNK